MLSEDERREIEEELPRYASRRAVCIDAMRVVQRHRGWLSDEALQDIAEFLGMTTHELEGVATFYNLLFRRPVGRHVILLCDSVSCWIMGYERVQEQLTARLGIEPGATTADGRFTLLPIVCLGACDRAPVMMVDDELHGDLLAPGRLDGILEGYA
jgi:NADH-quinone oxidoreductase subunit E